MGVLWVARHGETDWNRESRIQGHRDPSLNGVGLDQARDLAQRLALELEMIKPLPPLITSDLKRAAETAGVVAEALGQEVRTTPALRERGLGLLEGKTFAELAKTHPAEVEAYSSRVDRDAIPHIEPQATFKRRVLRAMRAIASMSDLAIVVTHGGVLRVLLETALGEDKRYMVSNTALYRFYMNADGIRRIG